MNVKILLVMIFLHIIDDFHIQGLLAKFKQKIFWVDYPALFRHDWIISLVLHCFCWTFSITLPFLITRDVDLVFACVFILNMVIHGITDHIKANKFAISLTVDQLIHICQIAITWVVLS